MASCVLLKFGEDLLKGRNRALFYGRLRRNVTRLLGDLGPLELRQRGGALAVLSPAPADELLARPTTSSASASSIRRSSSKRPPRRLVRPPSTCSKPAGRDVRDPRPAPRQGLCPRLAGAGDPLGRHVQDELGLGVDLTRPDAEVFLEVDKREIFAYTEKPTGRGGSPRRRLRPRARSPLRRDRLARGRLSGDEARPALRLRPLQRPPVYGARVDLQVLRARRRSSTASRAARGCTSSPSGSSSGGSRPRAPGGCSSSRSGASCSGSPPRSRGARAPRCSSPATRSARSPRRRCTTSGSSSRRPRCRVAPPGRRDKAEIVREAEQIGTLECRRFRPRTAAHCSRALWQRQGARRKS